VIFCALDDDARERDPERALRHYVTRKEFMIWIAAGFVALLAAYFIFYRPWKGNRDFVVSQTNLQAIGKAVGLYISANNEGLPAVVLPGARDAQGLPITWANQLFDYAQRTAIFSNSANPSDGDTWLSKTSMGGGREAIVLSYGMLCAASAARRYEVEDPTILLAETVGGGAMNSYDPIPLGRRDGYMIGYDNSNVEADRTTRYVTRVAFVSDSETDISRLEPLHGAHGTIGLRADGSIAIFKSAIPALKVEKRGNVPTGQWVPF